MAAGFGSSTNGFVAGFNAGMTERLIVDYARDWKKCPVVGLADVITSDLPAGYFVKIGPDPQGTLIDSPNAYLWPDNTPFPIQEDNRRQHEFVEYNAKRYTYGTWIGDLEKQFTAWDIEAQVTNDLGNQAMLNRAKLFYTLASTAGTYTDAGGSGVNHTASATSLGGGTVGAGTSANRYLEKIVSAVLQAMDKATVNGVQNLDDVYMVMSPTVADVFARSQEFADGFHRQQDFSAFMQYSLFANQMARHGLPPKLYGVNLVVDPWIERTAKIGATATKSYVAGTNVIYFLTKPGGIASASGGRSFGSFGFFTVKNQEMVSEVVPWPIDKRQLCRVTDMLDIKAISPASAYLVTAAVS
jgi:hypothetical protein